MIYLQIINNIALVFSLFEYTTSAHYTMYLKKTSGHRCQDLILSWDDNQSINKNCIVSLLVFVWYNPSQLKPNWRPFPFTHLLFNNRDLKIQGRRRQTKRR